MTSYYKNKLKQLYGAATADATSESEVLRKALEKIYEIKEMKTQMRAQGDRPKQVNFSSNNVTIIWKVTFSLYYLKTYAFYDLLIKEDLFSWQYVIQIKHVVLKTKYIGRPIINFLALSAF